MSKSLCRDFLIECKPVVKLSYFALAIGINKSTLSLFMKDKKNDYMISFDKINLLCRLIKNYFNDMSHFA